MHTELFQTLSKGLLSLALAGLSRIRHTHHSDRSTLSIRSYRRRSLIRWYVPVVFQEPAAHYK